MTPRVRVKAVRNIPFAHPEGETLCLDVVRPDDARVLPVLLVAHGGGWCTGSRADKAADAQRLARLGYVVCNIDYRLAPMHPFPAAVEDVRAAGAWIGAHAGEYGGNAHRFGAYGVSAGGYLVALLALMPGTPLACAVSWGGPMDLRHDSLHHRYRAYGLAFMGTCSHADPDLFDAASPAYWLTAKAPPLLLIHGACDDVVPVEQTHLILRAAEQCGAPVEGLILEEAGHAPGDPRDPAMARAWRRMTDFFAHHLG